MSGVNPASPSGFQQRFAAKILEEKRQRRERDAAAKTERQVKAQGAPDP